MILILALIQIFGCSSSSKKTEILKSYEQAVDAVGQHIENSMIMLKVQLKRSQAMSSLNGEEFQKRLAKVEKTIESFNIPELVKERMGAIEDDLNILENIQKDEKTMELFKKVLNRKNIAEMSFVSVDDDVYEGNMYYAEKYNKIVNVERMLRDNGEEFYNIIKSTSDYLNIKINKKSEKQIGIEAHLYAINSIGKTFGRLDLKDQDYFVAKLDEGHYVQFSNKIANANQTTMSFLAMEIEKRLSE